MGGDHAYTSGSLYGTPTGYIRISTLELANLPLQLAPKYLFVFLFVRICILQTRSELYSAQL